MTMLGDFSGSHEMGFDHVVYAARLDLELRQGTRIGGASGTVVPRGASTPLILVQIPGGNIR